MRGLPKHIMEYAQALPEATPLCPGALLHLGHRAAIDQALSRLVHSGELMRICQGVYMRPGSEKEAIIECWRLAEANGWRKEAGRAEAFIATPLREAPQRGDGASCRMARREDRRPAS